MRAVNRAAAEAAPGEPAIAARAAKPWRVEAGEHVGHHRLFAAEEMGAAGDVEHQAVMVERDERGVALGPVGDRGEERGVGGCILVDRVERGDHGAGVGERLAGLEAEAHRRLVEGDDAHGALDLRDDDEGRVRAGVEPSILQAVTTDAAHGALSASGPCGKSGGGVRRRPSPPPGAGRGGAGREPVRRRGTRGGRGLSRADGRRRPLTRRGGTP